MNAKKNIDQLAESFLKSAEIELNGKSIRGILPDEITKDRQFAYFKSCKAHSGTKDIIDFFSPHKGINYLDFGCNINLKRYDLFLYPWQYIGVEACKMIVSKMQEYIRRKGIKNAQIFFSNSIYLPFENESFDCCSSIGVLEYYPVDQAFILLKELYRVLKPKGKLILDIPNMEHPAFELLCKMERFLDRPVKLIISRKKFTQILVQLGISIEAMDTSEVMIRYYMQK